MDEVTEWEHRLSSDSPMCAGATPLRLGKEPRELRSEPRVRLKMVHFSMDLGSAWMDEHMEDHVAALALVTVSFQSVSASAAARRLS